MDTLGLYVSIPFCKAKCSFCNFASGVFAADRMQSYIDRICLEMAEAPAFAARLVAPIPPLVDTLYLGGGTPSLLPPALVRQLFTALRAQFTLSPRAEITVECAPQQLEPDTLEAFNGQGVNRISFGVQSFIDSESAAVGRLHTCSATLAELAHLRRAGFTNLAVDLIAGLPTQTFASWRESIDIAVQSGVDHISLYMLEVDDGSRLGREKLRGGPRYGAAQLPSDDEVADMYAAACEWLAAAGIQQYEISNFARPGRESRHNRKYWQRDPYLGFGLDAHSMLRTGLTGTRWANPDTMETYLAQALGARGFEREITPVDRTAAFEETLFLGLRLNEGTSLTQLRRDFGSLVEDLPMTDLLEANLVTLTQDRLRLTSHGRMISNEVFERLLLPVPA